MVQSDPSFGGENNCDVDSLLSVAEFLSFFQAQLLRADDVDQLTAGDKDQLDCSTVEQGRKRGRLEQSDPLVQIPTLCGGSRVVKKSELIQKARPVTPDMIRRVIEQRKVKDHHRAQSLLYGQQEADGFHRTDGSGSQNSTYADDGWAAYVNLLLDRLEVWGTKALAQHEFQRFHHESIDYSVGEGKINPATLAAAASSSLLGLPDGKLFTAWARPDLKPVRSNGLKENGEQTKTPDCRLLIPPNSLTWREYLRLSIMLSEVSPAVAKDALRHLKQCHNSSVWFDQVTQESHKWTRGELLATWVRAQRNTAAFRLLLHAFEFERVAEGEKEMVATFRGNTKLTRTKVTVESSLVDMLAEFAIMNQYLRRVESEQPAALQDTTTAPVVEGNEDIDDVPYAQLQCIQSIVLRWFARRNRPYLSFVFTGIDFSEPRLLIPELSVDEQTNYIEKVISYVQEELHSPATTLAAIDGRILLGRYESFDALRDAVVSLLSAYLKFAPTKAESLRRGLEISLHDCHRLCNEFSGEDINRFLSCGNSLSRSDGLSWHNLEASSLKFFPAPWMERPLQTERAAVESMEDSSSGRSLQCECCGVMVHQECATWDKVVKGRPLHEYEPLERIFCARIPLDADDPKEVASTVSWETLKIILKRSPSSDKKLPSWGLAVNHTESCTDMFDKIVSGRWNPNDPNGPNDDVLPVFFPQHVAGIIITGVNDGSAAERSGIRKGDVITHVYTADMCRRDRTDAQDTAVRVYNLRKMTVHDRDALFSQQFSELCVLVRRPSKDLVGTAEVWRVLAENTVRCLKGVVLSDTLPDHWCCSKCTKAASYCHKLPSRPGDPFHFGNWTDSTWKVIKEAITCRALIRRLSFEWCSIPFHEEFCSENKTVQGTSLDGHRILPVSTKHISFRRLDLMMGEIIQQAQEDPVHVAHNGDHGDANAAIKNHVFYREDSFPAIDPFYIMGDMPGSDTLPTEIPKSWIRVEWAPVGVETRPRELLCRGMTILLTSPSGEDPFEKHRRDLASQFISLFQFYFMKSHDRKVSSKAKEEEMLLLPTLFKVQAGFNPWSPCVCKSCGVRRCIESNEVSDRHAYLCHNCVHLSLGATRNTLDGHDREWTCFVGSTFLALPGDSILAKITHELHVPIDHQGRLVELIVVSYHSGNGPSKSGLEHSTSSRHDGYFYAFPILYFKVMQNLLSHPYLTIDQIEGLPGVVKVTAMECLKLVEETACICRALDVSVRENCTVYSGFQTTDDQECVEPLMFVQGGNGQSEHADASTENGVSWTTTHGTAHLAPGFARPSPIEDSKNEDQGEIWNTLIDLLSTRDILAMREFLQQCKGMDRDISPRDVSSSLEYETSIEASDDDKELRTKRLRTQVPREDKESHGHSAAKYFSVYEDIDGLEKLTKLRPPRMYDQEQAGEVLNLVLQRDCKGSVSDDESEEDWDPSVLNSKRGSENQRKKRKSKLAEGDSLDLSYSGRGWGMELVRWSDGAIRVGHLSPNSPANAQLQTHDVLLKVNGAHAHELESLGALAKALLCSCETECEALSLPSARNLLRSMRAPCSGPVVLEVFRPTNITSVIETFPTNPELSPAAQNVLVQEKNSDNVERAGLAAEQTQAQHRPQASHAHTSWKSPIEPHRPMSPATHNVVAQEKKTDDIGRVGLASGRIQAQHRPQTSHCTIPHAQPPRPMQSSPSFPGQTSMIPGRQMRTDHSSVFCGILQNEASRAIDASDLYQPGFQNSILTRVETAIMLHCFRINSPYLGLRLLLPRYTESLVRQDYDLFVSGPARERPQEIPQIPERHWKSIILADYKRSLNETGQIAFNENGYNYRFPRQVLPLDRLMESILKRDVATWAPNSNLENQGPPMQPHSLQLPPVSPVGHSLLQHPSASDGASALQANILASSLLNTQHQARGPVQQQDDLAAPGMRPAVSQMKVVDLVESDGENEHSLVRIRGGGCETMCLSDMDRSTWVKQFVVGRCKTTCGAADTGQANFIGRVIEVTDHPIVCIFHVSNAGILKKGVKGKVAASQMHVVASDEEKAIVREAMKSVAVLQMAQGNRNGSVGSNTAKNVAATPRACLTKTPPSIGERKMASTALEAALNSNDATTSPSGLLKDPSNNCGGDPSCVRSTSRIFIDHLLQCVNSANPLGFLPDGSAVYWMRSDPRALYIRVLEEHKNHITKIMQKQLVQRQREFEAAVARESQQYSDYAVLSVDSTKKFHCLWGCSRPCHEIQRGGAFPPLRETLSFVDYDSYESHVGEFHHFKLDSGKISKSQEWSRIEEGREIQRLCADLTSAACARSTEMISFTTAFEVSADDTRNDNVRILTQKGVSQSPLEHRITFDAKLMQKYTKDVSFSKLPDSLDRNSRGIVRLWTRIYHLFSVEENGAFRFSDKELYGSLTDKAELHKTGSNPIEKSADSEIFSEVGSYSSCRCFTSSIPGAVECRQCPLCLGHDEQWIRRTCADSSFEHLPHDTTGIENTMNDMTGVGCSLLSSFYANGDDHGADGPLSRLLTTRPRIELPLEVLKTLSLRVASHIPCVLQHKTRTGAPTKKMGCVLILNHSIWEGGASTITWAKFVVGCRNVRMLAQAFVVMLRSVDKDKMPKWWKATKNGWWRGVAVILQNPTHSSLALHLMSFDAAITEVLVSEKRALEAGKKKSKADVKSRTPRPSVELNHVADYVQEDAISKSMQHLMTLPVNRRMATVRDWAKQLDLKSFQGDYNEECVKCDDVGSLMCCEFCNEVQHCTCCDPPLDEIPEYDWVCDQCVSEINILFLNFQKTKVQHKVCPDVQTPSDYLVI